MAGGTLRFLHLGEYIVIGGLFAQLLFFGLFLTVGLVFWRRINKRPTRESLKHRAKRGLDWISLLYGLFVSSILILVRSIFRIIEYMDGNGGYIQRHEVFLYTFDGFLMLGVMAIFNIICPGKIIQGVKVERDENWDSSETSSGGLELQKPSI